MTNAHNERLEQTSGSSRRLLTLLVGLLATLALVVSGAASAAAQNAVGPQPSGLILAVGAQSVAAPEGVGLQGLPLRQLASATGVAAETGAAVLRPSSLADEVANATGGLVKANKGGYTVNIPNGSRGVTVRVMERGGARTNYYRVSVPGKGTYTVTGETSADAALTHIDIGGSSLNDILTIVARIQGGG